MRRSLPVVLAAVLVLAGLLVVRSTSEAPEPAVPPGAARADRASAVEDMDSPARSAAPPVDPRSERKPVSDGTSRSTSRSTSWSARLRGRLVDSRTGEGIPRVRVRVRTVGRSEGEQVVSDPGGRFESDATYRRRSLRLLAADDLTGSRLGRLSHDHRPLADGDEPLEALWRVDIGPTYRLRISGYDGSLEGWRARLLERSDSGEEREWPWLELVAGGEGEDPWVRYPRIEQESCPAWLPRLHVAAPGETWRGETPVASTAGVHRVRIPVVPWASVIRGRVVDEDGEGVDASVLALWPDAVEEDRSPWTETRTDPTGSYSLEPLPPGGYRLMVASDHRELARRSVELVAGESSVQDFVLSSIVIAGDVRGQLLVPEGGLGPFGLVRLRSSGDGATDLAELVGPDHPGHPDGAGRSEFGFEGLPAGTYRLTLVPLDGRSYRPLSIDVSPPAEGIVFASDDVVGDEDSLTLLFRVLDRTTGELVREYSQLPRLGPLWSTWVESTKRMGQNKAVGTFSKSPAALHRSPPGVPVQWVVASPGYVPAVVNLSDARIEGDKAWLVVELEPGWGAALVIVDAENMMGGSDMGLDAGILPAPGLAGAEVRVEGRPLGRSNSTGLAILRTDGPVHAFDVRLRGWTVLARHRIQGPGQLASGIGFVLMARE